MTDTALAAIEALLPWSTPREVPTKRGLRILRKAKPNEAFWNAWRAGKAQLQAHGIGVGKSDYSGGDWEVTWWREIPREIQAARAEVVEMSRATDAEIDVPCPDGLAYMPFQRAGIRYVLERARLIIGTTNRQMGHAKRNLSEDQESIGSSQGQFGQRSGTGCTKAGEIDISQDCGRSGMEAEGVRHNPSSDAGQRGESATPCGFGNAKGFEFQGRKRATTDGASASSGHDSGTARVQAGSSNSHGRKPDGSPVSMQLQGRFCPSDTSDCGGIGRSIPPRTGEAVGGFEKNNDSDCTRMESDKNQTRKGGMPIPSRGDSCGVLIADEMG